MQKKHCQTKMLTWVHPFDNEVCSYPHWKPKPCWVSFLRGKPAASSVLSSAVLLGNSHGAGFSLWLWSSSLGTTPYLCQVSTAVGNVSLVGKHSLRVTIARCVSWSVRWSCYVKWSFGEGKSVQWIKQITGINWPSWSVNRQTRSLGGRGWRWRAVHMHLACQIHSNFN